MSHKVHPFAHRLSIIRDWRSRWFGKQGDYQRNLKTDIVLREFFAKKLRGYYVDGIDMERGRSNYRILIRTARPGMIIGRQGDGAVKLREAVLSHVKKHNLSVPKELKIDIEEVRLPETHAAIVGQMVAEGLEKRLPFRRVMKQMLEKVAASRDVLGVRIALSGRLGGAEMSRREALMKGRLPLQTLRADVDFAREKAHLPYGDIGIKVWIYKGDIFEQKKAGF
ncbi:MAG: 30S ribosomal protein S3 [Candidatus Vogelbacteria bacterium CG10_big_fil_rev_8_21_14_0_10_51_16]|uniref:Small ribosomal subunit protein uS3 n=1 Tax=Candidatus Vogelbacteria bacterium CG10_big_fil_rev_8_21_14_0_10_51_16 TaxID=1975045 RepID=A0A2H0RDI9_9BACT|nr:MAG: 30S ribosomal protein S3 [Candidatus Vogelbacteria bacterium CG10_big_fil_rev_8_21_14_0_10_51_16]